MLLQHQPYIFMFYVTLIYLYISTAVIQIGWRHRVETGISWNGMMAPWQLLWHGIDWEKWWWSSWLLVCWYWSGGGLLLASSMWSWSSLMKCVAEWQCVEDVLRGLRNESTINGSRLERLPQQDGAGCWSWFDRVVPEMMMVKNDDLHEGALSLGCSSGWFGS